VDRLTRSVINSIHIDAPVAAAFDFVANPMNWLKYAVLNLKSVARGKDGWFNTVTRLGQGQLKIIPVRELGIFDHVWRDVVEPGPRAPSPRWLYRKAAANRRFCSRVRSSAP
jgi:hypothetical protein